MHNQIYPVPQEIDNQIAQNALDAMNIKIDKLSKKQIQYQSSW
jgi:adenosylhomocysteinase